MKYLVVVEDAKTGFSAYSPDLPGCVAAAATRADVEREMTRAVRFHIQGLRKEGISPPDPRASHVHT